MKDNEKQEWAIYHKNLKKWEKARPKNGNNYELEAWLEMKPVRPGGLPT